MKPGLGQHTQLRQELKINPRLYQAMDLLYMPLLDLQQHLKQELLNNPFLDLVEAEEDEEEEQEGEATEPAQAETEDDRTGEIVARATRDPRYHADQNATTPRKIGSFLVLFDCINCDKCIPVCPNDANFSYDVAPFRAPYDHFVVRAGAVTRVPAGVFEVAKQHQIGNFQDFCNECGNCDVFCPEDGGPYIEKPRFFGSHEAFRALPAREGFYAARAPQGAWIVLGESPTNGGTDGSTGPSLCEATDPRLGRRRRRNSRYRHPLPRT